MMDTIILVTLCVLALIIAHIGDSHRNKQYDDITSRLKDLEADKNAK